ncbi:MAG: 2-hydroxyacid dehydrogenase [Deltaproteobacteria bacterium]|nr:2-hydroxyacid dehydrogenase [Deltaproteobacteria bacterium]
MEKIVSLAPLPVEIIWRMMSDCGIALPPDLEIVNANPLSHSEIVSAVKGSSAILGDYTFKQKITREIALAAKGALLIQQPSVGYQHIDIDACTEVGIPVANTAGANTISAAEHTFMVALCLLKNLMTAHRSAVAGQWLQLEIGSVEIHGKTWGLIGMGQIGRAIAERLTAFGVDILYTDPVRLEKEDENRLCASYQEIDQLLSASDIVSVHCPLTDATYALIDRRRLALMKPSAVLINIARGEIVDEQALANALSENRIAGAAVDVFSEEPLSTDNPLLQVQSDNLILTPHLAGTTNESKIRIISTAISNLAKALVGEKPQFVVNEVGDIRRRTG